MEYGALVHAAVLFLMCAASVFSSQPTDNSTRRHVTSAFNEGCDMSFCRNTDGANNSVNIFHITARGENDTIHFVWSSYGTLAGIIARTTHNATFKIDWQKVKDKKDSAINFIPESALLYSSGVIFNRLLDFEDTNDTAKLSDLQNVTVTSFDSFAWDDFNQTINRHGHSGIFNTSSYSKNGSSGVISLMVQGFADIGRSETLPRLLHNSNTSYFELVLEDLPTAYEESRFALELILINGTDFMMTRSIADQHTPAVFYVDNIKFAKLNSSRERGYVSWKPVAYTDSDRHLANARLVHQYGLGSSLHLTSLPSYSIAHAFYGDINRWNLSGINISFGSDGDGFYVASNYTVWGGLIGYGEPPVDSLSLLIIIVISAGLGLPALLILCGGSVMCVKRLKSKKGEDQVLIIDPSVN